MKDKNQRKPELSKDPQQTQNKEEIPKIQRDITGPEKIADNPLNENKDKIEIFNSEKPIEEKNTNFLRAANSNNNMNNSNVSNGELLENKIINKEEDILENLLEIDSIDYIPNYLGKLCFEPLSLFVYDPKKNTFHSKKYEDEMENLKKLNNTSSWCNGADKLFVSGGNDNDGNIIDNLWIFDLDDLSVEEPIQMLGKYNHSMIYIPKKYVFIVGGNDENVYYLNIEEKKVENWGCLNKKIIEPALVMVNNYLYAFDNINKNEANNSFELSFEKTNLLASTPNWEIIQPSLSLNILPTIIIPKFFGISKESNNSIIFLGGNILDENDNIEEIKNYRYNIDDNIIEESEVPFVNISLKEKKFFLFNNKNDIFFLLPDFYKKCPQVVFYIKSKNIIKLIDYRPNSKIDRNKLDNKKNDINGNNLRFKNYDFNMPKALEKNENEILEIKCL